MIIRDTTGSREFKLPKLGLYGNVAKGIFFFTFAPYLLFLILKFFDKIEMSYFRTPATLLIIVWVMSVFFSFINDGFAKSNSKQNENISDLVTSTIYMFIIILSLGTLDKFSVQPVPVEIVTEVAAIKKFEHHEFNKNNDKDQFWFGIGYYDKEEKLLLNVYFVDVEKRTAVLDRIIEPDGNFKVDMLFKNINGTKQVIFSEPLQKMKKAPE